MTWLWLTLTLATAPVFGEVETDGVRVRTTIRASVYTYEVTNTGDEPLAKFEVPYRNAYFFNVPEGWEHAADDDLFRAWATGPYREIRPGRTGEFSYRVTSTGAVLGAVDARAVMRSGTTVPLPGVWGTIREPRSHTLIVAAALLVLFGVHCWVQHRRDRETTAA